MSSDITLKITDRKGILHVIQAPTDMSMNLMEIIQSYELVEHGTIGICGGMAMCASCHCYINSNHDLNPKTDEEDAMLSEIFNMQNNSRLGCQIQLKPSLNGLEINIATQE